LPVLLCAAAIGAALVAVRIAGLVRGTSPRVARELLRSTADGLARRSLLRDLPAIGALQIAGVFGIERAEAAVAGTAFAPGLHWLGAPVLAALGIHGVVCLLCIVAL